MVSNDNINIFSSDARVLLEVIRVRVINSIFLYTSQSKQ